MDEFQPNPKNTQNQQAPERRVETAISGSASLHKQSALGKLMKAFVKNDIHTVLQTVKDDVLIPAAKSMLYNSVTNGLGMMLGEERRTNDYAEASRRPYRSYDRAGSYAVGNRPAANVIDNRREFDEVAVNTRGDAEMVLRELERVIRTYKMVRAGDMFDAAGVSCDYTAYNYGWTDISSARIERLYDGRYIIRMPPAMPLD